ncbi:hypothetical protein [Burkholderia multivorans]|uniref:hypothetical protein n=1 Tax=Burkholderia multivorans TaxID=87883 RepID=UPI0011B23C44|nr:hypothetical protein [Burkholderia multivorans]
MRETVSGDLLHYFGRLTDDRPRQDAGAGEMPVRSIGGGVYTSHHCTLVVSDHPTHEEYVDQLNDYLKAVR